ncbi:exodeoxyribonuclease VII large subunit, partial [Candidatus Uhrbacteria bacterium]|nr:exodeoxyribonuclease VII large subunit [Candidatus Uhrbacteria bacterium]
AGSAEDLVRAIKQANTNHQDYDALVMTRGGGSLEDLMAFNDEQVVRAIYASKIPTMVGIGHERDISLAELAADVRGSTPTDCARRLVPDKADVLRNLAYQADSIERTLKDRIATYQDILARAMRSPGNWISRQKIELDRKTSLISANMRQLHQALQERYRSQIRLLASLDPKGVLARGYTMLSDARGRAITSTKALKVGTKITAILRDGESDLTVNQVRAKRSETQQKLL